MGKRQFAVAALMALVIGCEHPPMPQYKVGDRMPDLSTLRESRYLFWTDRNLTRYGAMVTLEIKGKTTHMALYNICNDVVADMPFAVGVKSAGKWLFDKRPTDGTIDDIIDFGLSADDLYGHAPECVTKLNI